MQSFERYPFFAPEFNRLIMADSVLELTTAPSSPASTSLETDHYPGDRWNKHAILALAGAFLAILPSFGLMVSIGTLQDYWQLNQLSQYSTQEVGWIPSVFVYVTLSLGICVGPIFDLYGPRWLLMLGSAAYVAMTLLLAECTAYWQFMLCLGVLGGPAAAALTTTSIGLVNRWFKVKRGFAIGVAMVGSSVGGIIIPLVLRSSFPKHGYAWTIRILAFVFAGCLVSANLCIASRSPPQYITSDRRVFALRLFREPIFSFLTLCIFGVEIVLFGALGTLPTYARMSPGYPENTGYNLIATLNGASCLGRVIPGMASDFLGRFNVFIAMMAVTLCFMLAIWLPFGATSLPALYLFTALFGFGTGSWMSLAPTSLGQLSGPDQFGRYYGTCYFVASLATLVGIPISGSFLDLVGPRAMVGFMCAVLMLSILALLVSRWVCVGRQWKFKVVI